ncbi:MAG: molybdate transporter family protein [Burkholderiaceae bacterium]
MSSAPGESPDQNPPPTRRSAGAGLVLPPGAGARTALISEVSGAFGDLGTFLPYVVAVLAGGILAPTPVLLGFAAGYLMVALVYRVPISVQPMKALGAMIVAGSLSPSEIAWAGAVLGAILLAFSASARLGQAARAVPQSVVTGLQAGLGLILALVAARLMSANWLLALPALALLACSYRWPRGPWALLVIIGGACLVPATLPGSGALVANPTGASGLAAAATDALPGLDRGAILAGILGQLPLTLLNAIVVTVSVSHAAFARARATVNERRLAATNGLMNLLLAPLGALPMCHGAGGVSAHHRFGARGIGAPLLLALACALGALAGPSVISVLARIPMPVVGALLLFASLDLILTRRVFDARADCRPVIAAAALVTFGGGAFFGLIAA